MKDKEEGGVRAWPCGVHTSDTVVTSHTNTAQGFDSFTQPRHASLTRTAQDWAFQLSDSVLWVAIHLFLFHLKKLLS